MLFITGVLYADDVANTSGQPQPTQPLQSIIPVMPSATMMPNPTVFPKQPNTNLPVIKPVNNGMLENAGIYSNAGTLQIDRYTTLLGVNTSSMTVSTATITHLYGIPSPTVQRFTSGSGTYVLPNPSPLYLRVITVGGGGGGSGSGPITANPTNGGSAGGTTFGPTLTANGGAGGVWNSNGGAAGGSCVFIPIEVLAVPGGTGEDGALIATIGFNSDGGVGGSTPLGGGAVGSDATAGRSGRSGTGEGGAGGGTGSGAANEITGSGGGAGCYMETIIPNPASTYSYAVGGGGTAGTGNGTGGTNGGAGGSGLIVVEEYYQ